MSTSSMGPTRARSRSPDRSMRPSSISCRTISSRKNGLPSARRRMRAAAAQAACPGRRPGGPSAGPRRPGPAARGRCSSSCAVLHPTPGRDWGELEPGRAQEQERAVGSLGEGSSRRSRNDGVRPVDVLDGHHHRAEGAARAEKYARQAAWASNRTWRGSMALERRGGGLGEPHREGQGSGGRAVGIIGRGRPWPGPPRPPSGPW